MKSLWKNSPHFKNIVSQLAVLPIRGIHASIQYDETVIPDETRVLLEAKTPVIYAIWHGRMYVLLLQMAPLDSMALLVSPSTDGEFVTRIARRLGFRHFVRGSHKRGGANAIRGMMRALTEEQLSVVFTVDGPRGPRYQIKPGLIRLASQTGAPIVPLTAACGSLIHQFERSWDNFQVPRPGTRTVVYYGAPIVIPANLEDAQIEAHAQHLQQQLYELNRQADEFYGLPAPS